MFTPGYETKTIEHLGWVASMVDQLGVPGLIDQRVPQDHEQRLVSVGQAVKAMILNGLGFGNRSLYLTPHFFSNKPTERLLGKGIKPEYLHDDTFGDALDKLQAFGVAKPFMLVSQQAVQRLGLSPKRAHRDATSFHVDGNDNSDEEGAEGVIHITRGSSRHHCPDLNQAVLALIAKNKAGIPFLIKSLSSNQSDKTSFHEVVARYVGQLHKECAGDTRAG